MRIILSCEINTNLLPISTGVNAAVRASFDVQAVSLPNRRAARGCFMAILPLRPVRLPTATEQFYDGWLADLGAQLAESGADWYRLTRDLLFQIYHPGADDYDSLLQSAATPEATRVALLSLDPWNV